MKTVKLNSANSRYPRLEGYQNTLFPIPRAATKVRHPGRQGILDYQVRRQRSLVQQGQRIGHLMVRTRWEGVVSL